MSQAEDLAPYPQAEIHRAAMDVALEQGWKAHGTTSPNPPVGAVIIRPHSFDGWHVLGKGQTQPAGGNHAEVEALNDAHSRGFDTHGATAVVTLEPCAHTGRTGPCAQALIDAGITTVVYACSDPNPTAQGGHQILESAGVTVISGVAADQASGGSLEAWLHRINTGSACVTLKVAATVDGYIAAADGTSQWITGSRAREWVHRDRARRDAIIVGTGTVLADNPRLTARTASGELYDHQPRRVVVGHSDTSGMRIWDTDGGQTIHYRTHDIAEVIRNLTEYGCVDVLIEGGSVVASAALEAGLVDIIDWYVAPTILGGGKKAISLPWIQTLDQRMDWQQVEHFQLGSDLLIRARRAEKQK